MAEKKILSYVYDFLSVAFDKGIRAEKIILFGSAARGNMRAESDIDIFFDVSDTKKSEKILEKSVYEFDDIAQKRWWPRKINHPIRPISGRLSDSVWDALRHEIISYGVTLFGSYEVLPKGLLQRALFTYDISRASPAKKVFVLRHLFGYTTIKGEKKYIKKGLVELSGGFRASKNSIFVPSAKTNEFFELFKKNKVPAKIHEIWVRDE
ncbi:MAG: nucleotidyltransferase domain-containing protein [Candidatus Aenigmarchaeota archaeon]|nr:nucleotidyltransferase domain-containing protein [Candidatus Aenigmarchaeota archaeon]MCK5334358.1 nucleotidyltransferase domain-containing protein [Candidatus Aenigmarchaeota archaeon]